MRRLEMAVREAHRRAAKAERESIAVLAEIEAMREENRRLVRINGDLTAKAAKAEAALAAVTARNEKVWRLQQEITRLRNRRSGKLRNAWKRVKELQAVIARLKERN